MRVNAAALSRADRVEVRCLHDVNHPAGIQLRISTRVTSPVVGESEEDVGALTSGKSGGGEGEMTGEQ
jgi:hypothetical protein